MIWETKGRTTHGRQKHLCSLKINSDQLIHLKKILQQLHMQQGGSYGNAWWVLHSMQCHGLPESDTTGSGPRVKVAVGLIFAFSDDFGRGNVYQNPSSYQCEALCCNLEPLWNAWTTWKWAQVAVLQRQVVKIPFVCTISMMGLTNLSVTFTSVLWVPTYLSVESSHIVASEAGWSM